MPNFFKNPVLPASRRLRRCLGGAFCSALMLFAVAPPLSLHAETAGVTSANKPLPPVVLTNTLGMEFRAVPGTPVLFSVWETRLADWQTFLGETKYDWHFTTHFPQTNQHPVVNVNLQDALAFCSWLTERERAAGKITALQAYRLPTNREWDAAVGLASGRVTSRALTEKVNDEQTFPWGTQWPPPRRAGNLNFAEITGEEDGFVYTAPVGSFDPSPDGLFDLAGNAWEWAWDQEVRTDIVGTLRGGSWMYFRKECLLSNYRYQVPGDLRAPSTGFRIVLEDKHNAALFAETHEKEIRAEEEKKRTQFMKRPDVSQEDINKMREDLAKKSASTESGETKLPDLNSLKPARADQPFTNSLGMTFRPAGTRAVLVAEYETRIQDYNIFLKITKREWTRKPAFDVKPSHPIMNVTWKDAADFCAWLTEREHGNKLIPDKAFFRLPTDAEWSAAAGLAKEEGDSPAAKHLKNVQDFPWGRDQWPPPLASANLDSAHIEGYKDSYNNTAPVGSFAPNAFQIYDMGGNVAEWCNDAWPGVEGERVARGSSWLSSTRESALTSFRRHLPESTLSADVGFRCVLEFPASAALPGE